MAEPARADVVWTDLSPQRCLRAVGILLAALFAAAAVFLPTLRSFVFAHGAGAVVSFGLASLTLGIAVLFVAGGAEPLQRGIRAAYACSLTGEVPRGARPSSALFVAGFVFAFGLAVALALLFGLDARQRAEPLLHGLAAVGLAVIGGGGTLVWGLPVCWLWWRTRSAAPVREEQGQPAAGARGAAEERTGWPLAATGALGVFLAIAVEQSLWYARATSGDQALRRDVLAEGLLSRVDEHWPESALLRTRVTQGEVVRFYHSGSCLLAVADGSVPFSILREHIERRPWYVVGRAEAAGQLGIRFVLPASAEECRYRGSFTAEVAP